MKRRFTRLNEQLQAIQSDSVFLPLRGYIGDYYSPIIYRKIVSNIII